VKIFVILVLVVLIGCSPQRTRTIDVKPNIGLGVPNCEEWNIKECRGICKQDFILAVFYGYNSTACDWDAYSLTTGKRFENI